MSPAAGAKRAASARRSRDVSGGRTLWLLRHAKAVTDPPPGGSDFDRVLAPRGRRDATALGHLFAGGAEALGAALDGVPRPDVALVSPTARTAGTADLVLGAMREPPEVRLVDDLYGADPEEVASLLRDLSDSVASVMVVGHNPTAQTLARELIAEGDKKGRSVAVRHGFPTCALGVYRFEAERWRDVALGAASLLALLAPPFG
jgi:phosphohistidine phosphatase